MSDSENNEDITYETGCEYTKVLKLNEEQNESDDSINYYINFKKDAKPCSVREARTWYRQIIENQKDETVFNLLVYLDKIAKKIPFAKITNESKDMMLEDGETLVNHIEYFNTSVNLMVDLYKNPKNYNAWKLIHSGQLTYFIEKKQEENIEDTLPSDPDFDLMFF